MTALGQILHLPRPTLAAKPPSQSFGIVPIPCMMIRGGTSRGVFLKASDLPRDTALRDRMLVAIIGSPHPLQIDGVGGGNPLTCKIAIVGPSPDPRADVDYLFAQVGINEAVVDTKANCGNILAGVAPFALETGLVAARSPSTTIRIRNVNTGMVTRATVNTPGGRLRYDGDQRMSGLAVPASPVHLSFEDAAGSLTDKLLPTGRAEEEIAGVAVSLVDYSIPVMIAAAESFGLSGYETPAELDANRDLFDAVERMRLVAGERMGLGDVSHSVTPKVALVAPPRNGGTIASRYLTPWQCHASHAVTGALCLAAATRIRGSVAAGVAAPGDGVSVGVEHPAGTLTIQCEGEGEDIATSVIRTARLLFAGFVYVPVEVMVEGQG